MSSASCSLLQTRRSRLVIAGKNAAVSAVVHARVRVITLLVEQGPQERVGRRDVPATTVGAVETKDIVKRRDESWVGREDVVPRARLGEHPRRLTILKRVHQPGACVAEVAQEAKSSPAPGEAAPGRDEIAARVAPLRSWRRRPISGRVGIGPRRGRRAARNVARPRWLATRLWAIDGAARSRCRFDTPEFPDKPGRRLWPRGVREIGDAESAT